MILGTGGFMLQSLGVELEEAGDLGGNRVMNAAIGLIFTIILLVLALFVFCYFVA